MEILGNYINGNYTVTIYEDGTKVRENDLDFFIREKPECMDIKITNYCDAGCPYCHEQSSVEGKHGDILNIPFLDSLLPYTELAIGGGNPLSHPDLIPFLHKLKEKNIIANITVNQIHFTQNIQMLKQLTEEKLIYGIGVSLMSATDTFISQLKMFPNAVVHVICGIVTTERLKKLSENNLKILFLGYKDFGRGHTYLSSNVIVQIEKLKTNLEQIFDWFSVVSFDNKAIEQLDIKSLLTPQRWNEFYMGDDGQFTMYVDMVERVCANNSCRTERFPITDNIADMFRKIK